MITVYYEMSENLTRLACKAILEYYELSEESRIKFTKHNSECGVHNFTKEKYGFHLDSATGQIVVEDEQKFMIFSLIHQ